MKVLASVCLLGVSKPKIASSAQWGMIYHVGRPRDCGLPMGLCALPFQRIARQGSLSQRPIASATPSLSASKTVMRDQ
jgi:hypothetical protein